MYEKVYASPGPPPKISFKDNWLIELDSAPLNPFGGDSDEEDPQFFKKCTTKVTGSEIKMLDQGLQFWQTKSHAIIVHSPVSADGIYRVISQNGDRILFERLSTPRRAPKVTLRSN